MALYLKRDPDGVRVQGIKPEMLVVLMVAEGVYREHDANCVVTSCVDSAHGTKSLHPFGYAVDLRTWNVPEKQAGAVAGKIKARLSVEYDVVLEDDHIHVEFDPR